MNSSTPKAREIEAMTFIFTDSAPGTPRTRPWTRLVRWAREQLPQRRPRGSVAMDAVSEPATRGTR